MWFLRQPDMTLATWMSGVEKTVRGLFYGDGSQFIAQVAGVVTNFIFVFVVMYVFFKILDKIVPLRIPEDVEIEGLDQAEVAVTSYPDFSVHKTQI